MKKPLPVKIVEALGWVYVALAALVFIAAVVFTIPFGERLADQLGCVLFCLFLLAVTVGMVISLRRGRRALFIVMHIIFLSFAEACSMELLLDAITVESLVIFVASSLLLVAPIVFLCLPSSDLWFKEKLGGKTTSKACLICLIVILVFIEGVVIPEVGICFRLSMASSRNAAMVVRGRNLLVCMAQNKYNHEDGQEWIDPAVFTNSTQFVQALCEKYEDDVEGRTCKLGPYTNIWCVAVNPPKDDCFPLIFTCNIDPRELLSQTEGDRELTLTCPKTWGGTCFRFCEKATVIGRVGGSLQVLKSKYARPKTIFRNGIPKPNPDTYFLTPTGRVDLVERQPQLGTDPAKPL